MVEILCILGRRVGVVVNFEGFFVSASSGQDRAEMARGDVDVVGLLEAARGPLSALPPPRLIFKRAF